MIRRKRQFPPKPIKPWKGPKPNLSMVVTPTCRVHFKDLEAYLKIVYKMYDYDVKRYTGARGDMTPEFDVTGVFPKTPNIWQRTDNIRRGRKTPALGLILNVLCVDGFIPAGKYVIDMTSGPDPIEVYRTALNESFDPLDMACVKIKEANRRDKDFMHQAKALDRRAIDFKKTQEKL